MSKSDKSGNGRIYDSSWDQKYLNQNQTEQPKITNVRITQQSSVRPNLAYLGIPTSVFNHLHSGVSDFFANNQEACHYNGLPLIHPIQGPLISPQPLHYNHHNMYPEFVPNTYFGFQTVPLLSTDSYQIPALPTVYAHDDLTNYFNIPRYATRHLGHYHRLQENSQRLGAQRNEINASSPQLKKKDGNKSANFEVSNNSESDISKNNCNSQGVIPRAKESNQGLRQEAIERFLQFPSYYETRLVPGSYAEYRYHQYFNKKFEKSYFKLAEERRKIAINHSKNWVPDLLAKLISIPTSTDQSISCYDPSDNSCSVKYSMVPHYLEKNGHSTSSQNQEISIISNEITPSEDQETKDHSLSAGPFLVMEEKSRYVELCAEEQIRTYLIPARNIESSNLCQDISEQFFIDKDKNEISITEIEDDVNNEQQTGSVLSGDLRTSSFSDSLSTDNNFTDCDTSQQNSEYYSCRSEDKSDLSHSQDNSSYESFYHEKVLCSSFENYDSLKSQSDLNLQSEFEKEIDAFEIPLNKENIIVPNKSFNRVFEFEAALYSKDCEQSLQLLENNYKSNLNRSMNNLKCCNFDKIKAPPNNTNFECSLEELKNVEELKNRSNEYFYRKKDQNDPNKSNFSNLTNNDSVNIFKNHININDSFVIQIEESLDCKPHLKTKETHCVPKTHHESLNDIQKHSEFLQIPTLKPISNLAKCSLLDTNLPYSHLVEWHEYFKEYFLPYIRTQQIKNIIKNDRESISRSKPCKIQATDPFVERFKKPINQLPFDFEMNNTDENNIEDIFLSTNQPMVDETYLSQEIINGAKNCYMTLSQGERRYLNLTTFEELGEPLNTYKLFPMMKKKQELKKQIDNLNASLEARQTYSSIVKRFAENIGNQENGFNCKTPSWISNREEMLNIFPSILKDNNHNINNLNQLGPCYSEVVKSGKKEKTKEFVGEPIFYNLKTIGPLCSSGKIDQICSKTQKIDANRKLELQKLYDMNLIQDSRRLQHYQALIRHKSDLEDRILGSSASNQFSATPTTLVDPKFFLHNIKSNSDSAKCLEVRYKEKVYMIHPSSNPEEYLALYFCWDEYWENDHFFLSRKPYTFMFQNNNNGIGTKCMIQ